jgi:hypothetical protein
MLSGIVIGLACGVAITALGIGYLLVKNKKA